MKCIVASQSERPVTIDGLGVFPPGETLIDEQGLEQFILSRGLPPHMVHLPDSVEITYDMDTSEEEKGE